MLKILFNIHASCYSCSYTSVLTPSHLYSNFGRYFLSLWPARGRRWNFHCCDLWLLPLILLLCIVRRNLGSPFSYHPLGSGRQQWLLLLCLILKPSLGRKQPPSCISVSLCRSWAPTHFFFDWLIDWFLNRVLWENHICLQACLIYTFTRTMEGFFADVDDIVRANIWVLLLSFVGMAPRNTDVDFYAYSHFFILQNLTSRFFSKCSWRVKAIILTSCSTSNI